MMNIFSALCQCAAANWFKFARYTFFQQGAEILAAPQNRAPSAILRGTELVMGLAHVF